MRRHRVGRGGIFGFQAVNLTRHIKQHGISLRSIKIVVHRFNEARFKRFAAGRRCGFIGSAQRGIQTLQRGTRLF